MIDDLQLSPDEAEWIERNRREIERMRQILPPDKFKSFLLRCLDFVREYPDLDAGGDWSLIKEIVWTELLLDDIKMQPTIPTASELEAIVKLQKQLESMVKTLGATRKDRRKEATQVAKIVLNMQDRKIAREKVRRDRKMLQEFIDRSRQLVSQSDLIAERIMEGGIDEGQG